VEEKQMERDGSLGAEEILLFGGQPALFSLYLSLRRFILDNLGPCEVRAHRTMVSFRAPRPYLWVSPPGFRAPGAGTRTRLTLSFSSARPTGNPLVSQTVPIRAGLYTNHLVLDSPDALGEDLLDLLRASLALRNPIKEKKP